MTNGQEGSLRMILVMQFSDFMTKQPYSSSREISKALYSPRTTILRVLDDLGLRFFAPRWIPHRVSDAQKADSVDPFQHMLDMMQGISPKQQK
jgi:hypothetical protein